MAVVNAVTASVVVLVFIVVHKRCCSQTFHYYEACCNSIMKNSKDSLKLWINNLFLSLLILPSFDKKFCKPSFRPTSSLMSFSLKKLSKIKQLKWWNHSTKKKWKTKQTFRCDTTTWCRIWTPELLTKKPICYLLDYLSFQFLLLSNIYRQVYDCKVFGLVTLTLLSEFRLVPKYETYYG